MRLNKIIITAIFAATLGLTSCEKLDRFPETNFSDVDFWNTETDLMNASNRLYQQLGGYGPDNRADDNTNQSINTVSSGTRGIPGTDGNWSDPYDMIFTANNILEKGGKAKVNEAIKNRYFAEARFFRAFAYSRLIEKYGDVPLVLKTLSVDDPDLKMGRSSRESVAKAIYDDLDFAGEWLPTRAALPAIHYGRVTKSSAWALKARVALFEGTRAKFHGAVGWENHLNIAVTAATAVMGQGHKLFPSYLGEFNHSGDGASNTENIFVKLYALTILTHNTSRDLENGRIAPTRNLIRQYLYTDGLPAWNVDGHTPSAKRSALFVPEAAETSYNTILDNRDPRLSTLVYRAGEASYQRPWVPQTSLGSRTAYAGKKGFDPADWAINNSATVQRIHIRYAEVLLILAEAKFELNGSITDADLDLTVNALRARAGFAPKLTNAFITMNGLSMREEIRRERTVELALEYFRYGDLIRWKIAENVLPKDILGGKYIASEWTGTNASALKLNADGVLITEAAATRNFNPARDYLYPVPLQEITLSDGNVKQNPGWQ
ncbi:RagB/SusD family nutrient uptake outer membrane protein [Pedobacter insulae]|nr:RagB/SusD family nutrient uptake outer membrane protein [Pedobacter insulae]